MKRYDTMVFDVGGTLLRFDLDKLTRAYVEISARHGSYLEPARTRAVLEELELELPTRTRERQISLERENGRGFWDDFYGEGFRRLGMQADMSAGAAEIRKRFQRAEFETLFNDVVPALDTLAARGIQMGILSNFSPNCEDVLHRMGIHRYFSFFVVSALAGVEKPDSRIFLLVVQAARRGPQEIAYIGDSLFHDIEGAARAGLDAILVDRHDRYPDFKGNRIRGLEELVAYAGEE